MLISFAALLSDYAFAQDPEQGYLCCNMHTDGSWISDINYADNGMRIIPAGTPVTLLGQGRYRINVDIAGKRQSIGNDYSRDLDLNAFAARYVVKTDPALALATYPQKTQAAIRAARLIPGMTREQVFMSVGYPVTSENPDLNAKILRFWISSFSEFQVVFDERGLVKEITADPQTRNLVLFD
jgi:hypothetical protein